MISSLFDQSTIPMLEQVVGFTQARHGVLAGNIANLDTPGYRTRDLSPQEFQERLKVAVENRSRRPEADRAAYPNSHLIPPHQPSRELDRSEVSHTAKGILRHDENNSSLEEQVSEIAKNNAQHNLALSLMNAQFRLLRAAVTERV